MSDLRKVLEQNRPAIEAGLADAERELAELDARREELLGLISRARAALGDIPPTALKPAPERLTLHEAMELVLRENQNEWVTAKGGFDLIAQGVSGLMAITGEPGGPPMKVGVPLTDLGAGLFALSGILAALHYRDRTGRGQYIDTSLVEAGFALSVWEAAQYFADGSAPRAMGSAHRMLAPYQAIRCADGFITIGAGTDRLFHRLAEVLGHAEWRDDPAYRDETARVQNRAALAHAIEAVTSRASRAVWLARLDGAGLPCGPINLYEEAITDPQLRARGMIVEIDSDTGGRHDGLACSAPPLEMSATPVRDERGGRSAAWRTHA